MKKLGIYVHIPFCERKCAYCDFLSFSGSSRESRDHYRDAVCAELKRWAALYGKKSVREEAYTSCEEYEVDTIFIGGGTPSVFETWSVWRIVLTVKDLFNCSDKLEITCEANPNSLDADTLSVWGVFGVNRLSVGVQSFDDSVLETLGRLHTSEEAEKALALARKYFYKNRNIDLMFGIPGQTMDAWKETLERAVSLEPEHISFYSLQVEEGTMLSERVKGGALTLPEDETDRAMYRFAVEFLAKNGYRHYEISNAAKPGYESKHNLKYWSMDEYIGIGCGAASYLKEVREKALLPSGLETGDTRYGVRFSNVSDYETYLEKAGTDAVDPETIHENTRSDYVSEFFFTGLRKTDGVSLSNLERATGTPIEDLTTPDGKAVSDVLSAHISGGLLTREADTVRFTEKGLDLANTVLRDFV